MHVIVERCRLWHAVFSAEWLAAQAGLSYQNVANKCLLRSQDMWLINVDVLGLGFDVFVNCKAARAA